MHTWHWISSAICLVCMMLFAITGITLNHASAFEAQPKETLLELTLPADVKLELNNIIERSVDGSFPKLIPSSLHQYLLEQNALIDTAILQQEPEWSAYEVYLQKPFAGGDSWISIDIETGELTYSHTDRGWVAWLNDLHKGRNTHVAWLWFIDIFAIATLIFCITGMVLLQLHSKNRRSTWYVTSAGFLVPAILAIYLV